MTQDWFGVTIMIIIVLLAIMQAFKDHDDPPF